MKRMLVIVGLAAGLLVRPAAPGSARGQEIVNVGEIWRLATIDAIARNSDNILIPINSYKLDGFINDTNSGYRVPSVRRTAARGRIVAAVPVDGKFYPGLISYDGKGIEQFAFSISGVLQAKITADRDDNRQHLFFLTKPYQLQRGQEIELRTLTSDGQYRTEGLILLRQKPALTKHEYRITDLSVVPEQTSHGAAARLTWITNWPAACTAEWESLDGGRHDSTVEDVPRNNHRVFLGRLRKNLLYRFRVSARTPDGNRVNSGWQNLSHHPSPGHAGTIAKARVQLSLTGVSNPGVPATDYPVTSGVPFPRGALGSDRQIRLLDPRAGEIPLQTRTLARWSDGTVKWVLLDFLADPRRTKTYSLEYGSLVSRRHFPSPLTVAQAESEVTVVTGPVQCKIDTRHSGFLDSVWLDSNRNGRFEESERLIPAGKSALRLTALDGRVYTGSAAAGEVVVEESGPIHAVIRINGEYRVGGRKLFAYTVRLHAYAGQPFLRMEHTFVNDNGAEEFTSIKGLSMELPLAAPGRWTVGTTDGQLSGASEIRLAQHRDSRFSVELGEGRVHTGSRAPGWAAWTDGTRTIALGVRDFWQNYPKDLVLRPGLLEFWICPPLRPGEYADAKGTVDEHRLYYYLQDGFYKFRQGVSKTHQFWLEFRGGPPGGSGAPAFYPGPSYLLAVAPPEWYDRSRALGELSPPRSAGLVEDYDAEFARSFEGYLNNREYHHEYGMLNFGDWWGEREINWGNSEYDLQHSLFLQFLRTGDHRYFWAGEAMEWHNRDVDTVHRHTDRTRVGGVYAHSVGHTGDYYRESPVPGKGIVQGHMSVDHTFIEGHLDYYCLTGAVRSLETARSTADRYDTYWTSNYDFQNCREPGWHLILTMAMYRATNDPFYLNAARIIVDRVLERQTPNGGWDRQLTPGHCDCIPRHRGEAGFMIGVLLTGLKYYYETTGDERVAKAIVSGAYYLVNDMWMPDAATFRYTSCPRTGPARWSNVLLFDGLVFAHQRTADRRLRDVLVRFSSFLMRAMDPAVLLRDRELWGQGFTQSTRIAPHVVGYLDDLLVRGGR